MDTFSCRFIDMFLDILLQVRFVQIDLQIDL